VSDLLLIVACALSGFFIGCVLGLVFLMVVGKGVKLPW